MPAVCAGILLFNIATGDLRQGLSELATHDARLSVVRSAAAVLAPDGVFVCTTHDPTARLRLIDGAWHHVGNFFRADGSLIQLELRGSYDEAARVVTGQQRVTIVGDSGDKSQMLLDLRFSLPSLDEVVGLARAAGLRLTSLYGDYDGGDYDEGSSSFIIATLAKAT